MDESLKASIVKYALQNAVLHDGTADVGAVIKKIIPEYPAFRTKVKELVPLVQEVVAEIHSLSPEEQRAQLERTAPELLERKKEEARTLPELPNVRGEVIVRFAPYPSGPLHIGNLYPAVINDEYRKKYKGKLLLIMDDTIGSEEKAVAKEAYDLIVEGLEWLSVKFEKPIQYKSERVPIYYQYGEKILAKGAAYVCFCSAEELRKNRENKIECECRIHSIERNIIEWKKMLQGAYKEGQAVVRIKTSMQDKNPAFRDRVLFRISNREHPRVGTKYHVWPLLEFSWAIDDYLLGITHIIRGKDLMIESDMEKYIWNIFGWEPRTILHTGLLRIEGVKLSKSKSQKEVREGTYHGWDDPRTWSIQSLRKRGMQADALRTFCLNFGLTKQEISAPIDVLYAENRKILEKSNRYFFVHNPVKIQIENAPELTVGIPLHPDEDRGNRILSSKKEFYIAQDDYEKVKKEGMFRLMHLFNIKADGKIRFVSKELDETLHAKSLHWLPADSESRILKAEIMMPDGTIAQGYAEGSIEKIEEGATVQFERFGFCRLDKKGGTYSLWFTHK